MGAYCADGDKIRHPYRAGARTHRGSQSVFTMELDNIIAPLCRQYAFDRPYTRVFSCKYDAGCASRFEGPETDGLIVPHLCAYGLR